MYTFFSRLWARGQEELKPAGLRRRSAVGAASKRGARARTAPAAPCPPFSLLPGTPRPLPAEFRQAREPGDAHAALWPGAGASRAPAQRAPLSSASTRVRRRVRSSFRTGAGGGRSAQALLPRTPHGRPCRHGEDGRRWRIPLPHPLPRLAMASSHCGGAWPRPAPGRVRAPQGRASWSRSANWEDGRPSASSLS